MNKVVWHLCSNRWNSAITEYALRSAQALQKRGWHSELSALPASHCERRAKEYGVSGPGFRFKLGEIFELRRYARQLKPALIITYGGPETFLARFLGVPVIRFRGQDSDLTDKLSAFELRLNLGYCRGILTPAKIVQERFQKALPKKKVESVTLGLDASQFFPMPIVRKRPTLLIVGRLDPVKGHKGFLEVFKGLLETHPLPSPFLQIIGQRSNLTPEELNAQAANLGLKKDEDYEIIDERVTDLPERMARAALGIVPSLGSEVIGRVTEEFLLAGTPVLLAPVGSLKECLIEEDFGDALTPESLNVWLKRASKESFDDRLDRSERAQLYFSLEAMGQNLEKALENILS